MKDKTITEIAFEAARETGRKPVLGLLLVHARGPIAPQGYVLDKPKTIGRDESADIAVDDGGVSRVHARFEPRGNAVWVTDLGSRNGTFAGGVAVQEGVLVPPGGVIRVAKSLCVVAHDVGAYLGDRKSALPALIGGAGLDDVRTRIETIAESTSPVLLLGETGTGKEVAARAIHDRSGRKGDFVALNCAAVPSELVDAELFGHSRGAFSGAHGTRAGLFRSAEGGTIFLDEIGEMPAVVQAKLLRVLETHEVRAIGEDKVVEIDARVIAATNRDVDEMVDCGQFREDLVHRLSGLRILIPPLRERIEDVPVLAHHFLKGTGATISALALEGLMLHKWPGNVRELRNVITSAAQAAKHRGSDEIDLSDVSKVLIESAPQAAESSEDADQVARIVSVLEAENGNVERTAERLGISRSGLYEALRRHKIRAKSYKKR